MTRLARHITGMVIIHNDDDDGYDNDDNHSWWYQTSFLDVTKLLGHDHIFPRGSLQNSLRSTCIGSIIISTLQVLTTTAFRFQIKDSVPSARKKSRPVVHLRRLLLLLHRLECWAENIIRTLYLCSTKTRYWEIHPLCPQDFPIPPEFWWSTNILSSSIFLHGVDQDILPCGQQRIDTRQC